LKSVILHNRRSSIWSAARLSALAALLFSASATAGGDFGEIRITSFQIDPEKADVFEFHAVSERELFVWRECSRLTIKGDYDSLRWLRYKRPMSATTHETALEYLQKASESGAKIGFGTIGSGLKKLEPCVFESKGLFVATAAGQLVVFSVHSPI
jgi:hypothetical protein